MTETKRPPQIEGAVGLTWRPRVRGNWECRWQARTDIIELGWRPKTIKMFKGSEEDLTPILRQYIAERSHNYQDEMLAFYRTRGGIPQVAVSSTAEVKTWGELCDRYMSDPDSKFVKPGGLRFKTRKYYRTLIGKIRKTIFDETTGQTLNDTPIKDTKARHFLRLHERWLANPGGKPHVTAAASGITMCRILTNFGATILESDDCKAAADCLSRMTFQAPKPRDSFLELQHVIDIRKAAHELGWPSIALAQAIQYEGIFRQKDILGEWVPIAEQNTPLTDVMDGNDKWIRGIRWEEIDANLILVHLTSKRQKVVTVPLLDAPMVVEELRIAYPGCIVEENGRLVARREMLPASGPVIVSEKYGVPWTDVRFRMDWRKCADKAGVPRSIKNMDSRSGAITEATEAGAPIEHVKHAAGHSQQQQTEQYARNQAKKGANVLNIRAASRQKSGN